jgi:hypothetical protein
VHSVQRDPSLNRCVQRRIIALIRPEKWFALQACSAGLEVPLLLSALCGSTVRQALPLLPCVQRVRSAKTPPLFKCAARGPTAPVDPFLMQCVLQGRFAKP